jgi:ArsR family transcriptional regulator
MIVIILEHIFNYSMSTLFIPGTWQVLDEQTAAYLAELFRSLSDPSRVRIISALSSGEKSVSVLADALGLTISAVSHHLRGLRQMRLVRARKDGRQVYYTLDDEHIEDLYRRGLDHALHR